MSDIIWKLLVARNMPTLSLDQEIIGNQKGIQKNGLYWKRDDALVIRHEKPLSYILDLDAGPFCETNILDFLDNDKLDSMLDEFVEEIVETFAYTPSDNKEKCVEFYEKSLRLMALMIMGYDMHKVISMELQKEDNFDDIKEHISRPYKQTLLGRENIRLSKKVSLEEAKELEEEFGFVHSEYCGKSWTYKEYLDYSSDSPIEETELPKLNVSEKIQTYIDISKKILYIFDESKMALVKAHWCLRETIKRMGFDEDLLIYATEKEFYAWIKTDSLISTDVIERRKKTFAIVLRNGVITYYDSVAAVEHFITEDKVTIFDDIQSTQVKGAPAFKGVVSGKARIVFTQKDSHELEEGEILIASMTTPELVPAMRQASAFVTDEGGITCHAAIVAREMQKPCVIGTKIATRVFKTGDLVEVDAVKGIVRKITD